VVQPVDRRAEHIRLGCDYGTSTRWCHHDHLDEFPHDNERLR
jgi:hypothetical protein